MPEPVVAQRGAEARRPVLDDRRTVHDRERSQVAILTRTRQARCARCARADRRAAGGIGVATVVEEP